LWLPVTYCRAARISGVSIVIAVTSSFVGQAPAWAMNAPQR
jgi:hypothetical protein